MHPSSGLAEPGGDRTGVGAGNYNEEGAAGTCWTRNGRD